MGPIRIPAANAAIGSARPSFALATQLRQSAVADSAAIGRSSLGSRGGFPRAAGYPHARTSLDFKHQLIDKFLSGRKGDCERFHHRCTDLGLWYC